MFNWEAKKSYSEHIKAILPEFEKYYASLAPESLIRKAQNAFRIFWENKIMNENVTKLSELEDLDPIIRLLDIDRRRNYEYSDEKDKEALLSKLIKSGEQYGLSYKIKDDRWEKRLRIIETFGIARCVISQKDWYAVFNDLKKHSELRNKLDSLFKEEDPSARISLINELKELSARYNSKLITFRGVPLTAILCCYNPYSYVRIVSLRHRKFIIEKFDLGEYPEQGSYGEQIILSNELLKEFNKKFGTNYDLIKLSYFFYFKPIREIWEIEKLRPQPPLLPPPPSEKKELPSPTITHSELVNMICEIGRILGFYVKNEESTPDHIYRCDVTWRDYEAHSPLKVFEVEMSGNVDHALSSLTHAYDIWRPEQLYLIVLDERDLNRALKLVEPRLMGAFSRLRERLKVLTCKEVKELYDNLSSYGSLIKELSRKV